MCDVLDIFAGVSSRLENESTNGSFWTCVAVAASGTRRLSSTKEIPQGILVKGMASCCGPRNPRIMQLERIKKDPIRLCTQLVRSETE